MPENVEELLKNLPKKKRKGKKGRNTRKRTGSFLDEDLSKKKAPAPAESSNESKQSSVVTDTSFKSNRSVVPTGPEDGGATVNLDEANREKERIESFKNRLKKRKLNEDGASVTTSSRPSADADDEIAGTEERYTGIKGYTNFRPSRESSQGKFTRPGPVAPSEHIRVTSRFDYQPDLCKDYKETGYCGYGDSCKFLHDRGDYKAGWQIENDWNAEQKRKKAMQMGQDVEEEEDWFVGSDDEEELPFACAICRESFVNPVVTKCGHYFCEKCAFDHYRKNTRCFTCNKPTQGIFNVAEKLLKKMDKMGAKASKVSTSDLPDQKYEGSEASWNYS